MATDPYAEIQQVWSDAIGAAIEAHTAATADPVFAAAIAEHDTEIVARDQALQDAVAARVSTFDAYEAKIKPAVDAYNAAVKTANEARDAALAKLPPQPGPAEPVVP